MAAVFALVFVPGLAAVLCILALRQGPLALSTTFAAVVFVALVSGLFAGLLRLAHTWEDEPPTGT